jgi:hypothetical protein
MYVARPYNFNVTPLFIHGDRLDINRDITLSSSAIQFLIKNSFDLGAVFQKGVPYLSREEEVSAKQIFAKRQTNAASIPDIVIPENDAAALKWYNNAKQEMSNWVNATKVSKWQTLSQSSLLSELYPPSGGYRWCSSKQHRLHKVISLIITYLCL